VRQRTRGELQSHHVFADRSGRPDKGKVEGLVGRIRRNLLVPVPRATSLDALNEQLDRAVLSEAWQWPPGGRRRADAAHLFLAALASDQEVKPVVLWDEGAFRVDSRSKCTISTIIPASFGWIT